MQRSEGYGKGCLLTVLKLLVRFKMQSAYSNLYTMDRILTTLPICFTNHKIKLSKLKYIKSRLRPIMGQERLISLMMINVEQSLIHCVNFEDIIDSFANFPLLRKLNFVNISSLICKNLQKFPPRCGLSLHWPTRTANVAVCETSERRLFLS